MPSIPLPPIFQDLKGLKVTEIGNTPEGYPYIRLSASKRSTVRDIIVWCVADQPADWRYAYSYVDVETHVLLTKKGKYGDPEKDEDGEWISLG